MTSNPQQRPAELGSSKATKYDALTLRCVVDEGARMCDGRIRSYSGRFVYHKRCLGVVVQNPIRFAGACGAAAALCGGDDLAVVTALLDGMYWDAYGHDFIVYWPDLEADGLSHD